MRIVQINVTASLSTGRIAAALCRLAQQAGHKVLLCYGRDYAPTDVPTLRVGAPVSERPLRDAGGLKGRIVHHARHMGVYRHALLARLTDRAGFFSKRATQRLVRRLEEFKPDIVHLHNLHGYYLHLPTLFDYLRKNDVPTVWTLHDCWAYTGHCAYYTMIGCERWLNGCGHCPAKRSYPASLVLDRSARNWREKRALFSGLSHLVLTTPSNWLRDEVRASFLGQYPVYALPNGLDLSVFRPCESSTFMATAAVRYGLDDLNDRRLVISVAAVWDERKGLDDLIALSRELGNGYCVAAVGLTPSQIDTLPAGTVMGIPRTGNLNDLCALYTAAEVCVSLSREETMGMTMVEALACGTQVLCYDAAALPEIVTDKVGAVVPVGDIAAAAHAVRTLCAAPKPAADCLARAAEYEANYRFGGYLRLYENMYQSSPAWQQALQRTAGKAADEVE